MMESISQTGNNTNGFVQGNACILAIAAVPVQCFGAVYGPLEALKRGTIFRDLDLPFYIGGGNDGR